VASGSDDAGGTSHRSGAIGHRRDPKRPRPTVGRASLLLNYKKYLFPWPYLSRAKKKGFNARP